MESSKIFSHEMLIIAFLIIFSYLFIDELRCDFTAKIPKNTLRSPFLLPLVVFALAFATTRGCIESLFVTFIYIIVNFVITRMSNPQSEEDQVEPIMSMGQAESAY